MITTQAELVPMLSEKFQVSSFGYFGFDMTTTWNTVTESILPNINEVQRLRDEKCFLEIAQKRHEFFCKK